MNPMEKYITSRQDNNSKIVSHWVLRFSSTNKVVYDTNPQVTEW